MTTDIRITDILTPSNYKDDLWLKEEGDCLDSEGSDWSEGRFSLPFYSVPERCLADCKTYMDATACEYDYDNRACFYFTSDIVTSSGHEPLYCWIKSGTTKV